MGNLKITVTITDSTGARLSGSRVGNLGMLDSPHNTGTDYEAILTDLARWLLDRFGASVPNLQSLANGQGYTGTGYDTSSVWAQWVVPGNTGLMDSHAINFRYQPNFATPDVYSVNVNTLSQVYSWMPGGSLYFTFAGATSSYSFTYVYEDDANSGNDAGKDFSTSTGITLGSYRGFGYGADRVDMYKFDGHAGQTIYYNLVPPSSGDYGVSFYDPSWTPLSGVGGDLGTGQAVYGSFTPITTGSYFEKIYLTSGSGTYSFTLSTSPISPAFSIAASPNPIGVECVTGTTNTCYTEAYGTTCCPIPGSTITLTGNGGSGVAAMSAQAPTNGWTLRWQYASVSLTQGQQVNDLLTISAPYNLPSGWYYLTVTGTAGSNAQTTTISVSYWYQGGGSGCGGCHTT